MRYLLAVTLTALVFLAACKKDKFTTAPQINYKSLSHNAVDQSPSSAVPTVTLHITDAEGDLGITGSDTAWVFLKNLLTDKSDSLPFPDLMGAAKKNFEGDLDINVSTVLECKSLPGNVLHTDTLYFQFFVKDFAKNKSNVVTTPDPVYFICR